MTLIKLTFYGLFYYRHCIQTTQTQLKNHTLNMSTFYMEKIICEFGHSITTYILFQLNEHLHLKPTGMSLTKPVDGIIIPYQPQKAASVPASLFPVNQNNTPSAVVAPVIAPVPAEHKKIPSTNTPNQVNQQKSPAANVVAPMAAQLPPPASRSKSLIDARQLEATAAAAAAAPANMFQKFSTNTNSVRPTLSLDTPSFVNAGYAVLPKSNTPVELFSPRSNSSTVNIAPNTLAAVYAERLKGLYGQAATAVPATTSTTPRIDSLSQQFSAPQQLSKSSIAQKFTSNCSHAAAAGCSCAKVNDVSNANVTPSDKSKYIVYNGRNYHIGNLADAAKKLAENYNVTAKNPEPKYLQQCQYTLRKMHNINLLDNHPNIINTLKSAKYWTFDIRQRTKTVVSDQNEKIQPIKQACKRKTIGNIRPKEQSDNEDCEYEPESDSEYEPESAADSDYDEKAEKKQKK
jgi:hypothetical protein